MDGLHGLNGLNGCGATPLELLRRTYQLLRHRDGHSALDAALVATVEAAVRLAAAQEEPLDGDPGCRSACVQEAYACARAAATAARFAVIEEGDRCRLAGGNHDTGDLRLRPAGEFRGRV